MMIRKITQKGTGIMGVTGLRVDMATLPTVRYVEHKGKFAKSAKSTNLIIVLRVYYSKRQDEV